MPSTKNTTSPAKKPAAKRRGSKRYRPQLDHDRDGDNGGSLPKSERAPKPPVAAEPVVPELAPIEEAGLVSDPAVGGDGRLGPVTGRLHRVSLADVLSHLGEEAQCHVAHLRQQGSTVELQERIRANEGGCAPIIFTEDGDRKTLFHGFNAIAALLELGVDSTDVVFIDPGDARAVQVHLAAPVVTDPAEPESEDDLYLRVHAYHRELEA